MNSSSHFRALRESLRIPSLEPHGWVTRVRGLVLEGQVHGAGVGDLYRVGRSDGLLAEVIALSEDRVILMPYGDVAGLRLGMSLVPDGAAPDVSVGPHLLGRVIDAFGRPLDGRPLDAHPSAGTRPLRAAAPAPLERRPIAEQLGTGIRALDALVPCGRGQRLGIFAGPGVGKSTLMGTIARGTDADVVVLALVGERGREVGHFIRDVLGPEGLSRTVVVVATSDRPAPERVRAPFVATAIAEDFRERGHSVLLFIDSLTRLCMAQREIGLAAGEPPTTRGYPPSSFSLLPSLLERAASTARGSITALYTVLVEGDDPTEPVADTVKGLLDGHVLLSRKLAERGQFPAIDVLASSSRLAPQLLPDEILAAGRSIRENLGRIEDAQDLVAIGAYETGRDPALDRAMGLHSHFETFLRQNLAECSSLEDAHEGVLALAAAGGHA